ncbi:MAG: hypothetical protein ACKOWE_04760 [Micrococcales bacterium]
MSKPIEGLKGLFGRVLKLGSIFTVVIALAGAAIGYAVAGTNGLISALIGALVCFAFSAFTALSVYFGSRLSLGGFFGLVMGGWLLKLVLFFILIATLRNAEFINGPVFFFTLVAAILTGLAIDSVVFLKARIPIEPKN